MVKALIVSTREFLAFIKISHKMYNIITGGSQFEAYSETGTLAHPKASHFQRASDRRHNLKVLSLES